MLQVSLFLVILQVEYYEYFHIVASWICKEQKDKQYYGKMFVFSHHCYSFPVVASSFLWTERPLCDA